MVTMNIGYVNSNREQICRRCGRVIRARERSVKYTRKFRGRISMTESFYVCLACEKGAADMLTITIQVDAPAGQAIGIKEDLAQHLEQYGDARVVSITEELPEQLHF